MFDAAQSGSVCLQECLTEIDRQIQEEEANAVIFLAESHAAGKRLPPPCPTPLDRSVVAWAPTGPPLCSRRMRASRVRPQTCTRSAGRDTFISSDAFLRSSGDAPGNKRVKRSPPPPSPRRRCTPSRRPACADAQMAR